MPVIQILAWVGIVQALQAINMDILLARGALEDDVPLRRRRSPRPTSSPSRSVSSGASSACRVAYAISTTLVEPAQTVLAARALDVSPMVFVRAIGGVFQAAIGMCVAVLALRAGLVDAGVAAELRLVACVAAGALVYGALCLWRVPEVTAELRVLLDRRSRRSAPLVAAAAES